MAYVYGSGGIARHSRNASYIGQLLFRKGIYPNMKVSLSVPGLLTILIVLKLMNLIQISWLLVFLLPIAIPVAIFITFITVMFLWAGLLALLDTL
jgi:uncharacterized membrane protein YhhN